MNRHGSKNSIQTSGSKRSSKANQYNDQSFGADNQPYQEVEDTQEVQNAKLREQLKQDVKSMKAGTASFG